MRDKVLTPLRNEVMKIQVQPDLPEDQLNKQRNKMLDFKLVFRKDSPEESAESDVNFKEFLQYMQAEKNYMPPVRVLFCGDD